MDDDGFRGHCPPLHEMGFECPQDDDPDDPSDYGAT
jgi:hypothetical protein